MGRFEILGLSVRIFYYNSEKNNLDFLMKKKILIAFLVFLLMSLVSFMIYDLYFTEKTQQNPYEYEIKETKIDTNLIWYKEIRQIVPAMESIKAVAVDKLDNVYIGGKDKMICYDKTGKLMQTMILKGEAKCLAIGSDNKIYVGMKNHVEIWDSKGIQLTSWKPLNDEAFYTSIAVTDDAVYVADFKTKTVLQFDINGKLTNTIGKKDVAKGIKEFIVPSPYFDVAIGRDGELWIVNPGNHTFEAYNKNGNLISSWGKTSMQLDGFSGCCNPSHIAILSDGSFVTSEKGIERVKIHAPSGEFKCVVAAPDKFKPGTRGLDLAVGSDDKIYILDPEKKLVRIFELKKKVD